MHAQRKDRRGDATPVIIMVIAAMMATAGILLNDFSPGNGPQGRGNPKMITAAALSRAGAIAIPSEPSVGRSAS